MTMSSVPGLDTSTLSGYLTDLIRVLSPLSILCIDLILLRPEVQDSPGPSHAYPGQGQTRKLTRTKCRERSGKVEKGRERSRLLVQEVT